MLTKINYYNLLHVYYIIMFHFNKRKKIEISVKPGEVGIVYRII